MSKILVLGRTMDMGGTEVAMQRCCRNWWRKKKM